VIDWLVSFALRKRLVVAMICVFAGVYGYYSWTQLAVEAYPDVADTASQVVTQAPGLAAEEVEQQVTIPLERELNGTPGLTMMRSRSTFGLSLITLVFRDGVEDYWSRQRILERIAGATLPPGLTPGLDPLSSPTGQILYYTLQSDSKNLRALSEIQQWTVIPALKQVPGVADVSNFGGLTTQFQLELDPQQLMRFNLSLATVTNAISANNANAGGSVLNRGELGYVIRGIGLVQTLDDLGNIVVSQKGGTPILMRDLGRLKLGNQERHGVVGQDDINDVVEGTVLLLRHENPSRVLEGVHAKIDELNARLNRDGVRIVTYLDRATFNLTYRHPKKLHIASSGLRISEDPDPGDKDAVVTKYQMAQPVPLVTFALAPFQRHADTINWDNGAAPIPLEFNSLSSERKAVNEKFILQEMSNSVRYFNALFGAYPYPAFSAALHPFGFGQGFPSLLMIPSADDGRKQTYQFIAHETAHQWWGGIVAWRSYRDQWLSEGFAEYSGILYTGLRESRGAKEELLTQLRNSLKDPPQTLTGIGKGRLVDVGPMILGHRLITTKTGGAYQTLIYNKGALVLRMLHYMLSNPSTGEGQPFFDMMTDFVERYRNKTASTDDFRAVVNEHFAKTGIAKKYGMTNLNWLFRQFVYQSELPSYEMQYKVTTEADGKVFLTGTITQKNAGENWVMVLPVRVSFGDKQGMGSVIVQGETTPFKIPLPAAPSKVQLDPDRWILAESVSTKGN